MRRSARLTQKYANCESEAQKEPNAKKNRRENKHSNIATFDNGTMVESFKYLNYCELATSSLVSKRYRNLIQTHRHSLARLYVSYCGMSSSPIAFESIGIKIFDKCLSTEAYDEWVIRNNYSKQVASNQSTQNGPSRYELIANAHYKNLNHRELSDRTPVLFARVELNDETWPVFKHFVHLLTDPFICIRWMEMTTQKDVYNLLVATIARSNHGLLCCENLDFNFERKSQKFFNWIKNHVHCVKFRLAVSDSSANCAYQVFDFFATGSHCTSEIVVKDTHLSKTVIVSLVQKFIRLRSCDESRIVNSVRGTVIKSTAEALETTYEKFFIKEEKDEYGLTPHVFEIVNADIGKKILQSRNI